MEYIILAACRLPFHALARYEFKFTVVLPHMLFPKTQKTDFNVSKNTDEIPNFGAPVPCFTYCKTYPFETMDIIYLTI